MIVACCTENVKEGVILYAALMRVNTCQYVSIRVNQTLNPSNSKKSAIKIVFFIMRRVCNNFSNKSFPDQLKYYCNTFMLQYRLKSIFRNVNIYDLRN